MATSDEDFLAKALIALESYVHQLVVAGAWAHRLYRYHPLASLSNFEPIMTADADMAGPAGLPKKEQSIPSLLRSAGFRLDFRGDTMIFRPEGDDGFYLEFIAPLKGSGHSRSGRSNAMTELAGVSAPKLRFVELLLVEPWILRLSSELGFSTIREPIELRVANPVCYLAQKVLSLPRRTKQEKKDKDALYVHDTLSLFSTNIATLRESANVVREATARGTFSDLQKLGRELFSNEALLKGAARIAQESGRPSPPSFERIGLVCRTGLSHLFG
jgi:hypothetical protein